MKAVSRFTRVSWLAAGLACAAFGFTTSASAAGNASFVGGTGTSCAYSSVTITPAGDLTINCNATTPGAPGTLQLSSSTYSVAAGASTGISVTRTGGVTGAISATVSVASGPCTISAGTVSFADQSAAPSSTPQLSNTATGASSCTISLASANAGSPTTATVTITASGGTTTPPPTGCTATAYSVGTFQGEGSWQVASAPSGNIVSYALPTNVPAGSAGIRISFGEVVQWPGGTIELVYSQCPGDMTGIGIPNPNATTPAQTWFGGLMHPCAYKANIGYTQTNFTTASYDSCYLPQGQTWYANLRLTYTNCAFNNACGPSIQWNHQ